MATYVRHQEIAHPIGSTGRLSISVSDGDVRLRAVDGDEVRLRATFEISANSDDEADRALDIARLQVSEGPSSLEINDRGDRDRLASALSRLISGRGGVSLSIEGEAPRGCAIQLETVSGDLVVEGLRGDQRYTAVSGDLFATELAGSLRVNSVSGDATIRAVEPVALRAETVSGDVSAIAPRFRELRLTTVSGDLEIEGELGRDGEFRAETVSGDMTMRLLGSATIEVRGISSDIHAEMAHRLEGRSDRRRVVIGDGRPQFVFSSMSGDVAVRKPRLLERGPESVSDAATPAVGSLGESSSRVDPAAAAARSLEVLRALERGEIDVEEATRRLSAGAPDA